MTIGFNWQPIDTLPFGERVAIFYEHGEKGNGQLDYAWIYPRDENNPDGPWYAWTWGGANSGDDYELDEKPVMWAEVESVVGYACGIYAKLGGS